jgi:hypothetical protein
MLGKAERTAMLATVAATHESRRNRLQPREISLEEQRHPRTSCSFRPSLPPYPLTPRRPSAFRPFPVRRARKQFPCSVTSLRPLFSLKYGCNATNQL